MKIFYDTEFHERGNTYSIDLISIGAVREDGERFYFIVDDISVIRRASKNKWMAENVLSQLPLRKNWLGRLVWDTEAHDYLYVMPMDVISKLWAAFVLGAPKLSEFDKPELWAYYGAYDHVVMAQMFGRMIDLPEGMPMYTMDIKQRWHNEGKPKLPEQEGSEHNALDDAYWNKLAYEYLEEYANR